MAKDWPYAKATKWMSENGGPQKAFEAVKTYYTNKGYKEGAASKNPVIVIVGLSCLGLGIASKYVYDKLREKKETETKIEIVERAKVKQAEEEIMTVLENAEVATVTEIKENDL